MTLKEFRELTKDMPENALIVPLEKPFNWTPDTITMVGYDAKKNEISVFDYYNYTIC